MYLKSINHILFYRLEKSNYLNDFPLISPLDSQGVCHQTGEELPGHVSLLFNGCCVSVNPRLRNLPTISTPFFIKNIIKTMNSKMTTNSQLSTTEPEKQKQKLSQQLEQEQNHRNGDHVESYQWVGGERTRGKGARDKKQNR